MAPVADMVIDRRYQREISTKARGVIQRIAQAWDWRCYQPITVTPSEGGKLAIVDGQHRAHAAALCGITHLPAMEVEMTAHEAAVAFNAINTRRTRLSRTQVFHAALFAGEGWARELQAAVSEAGVEIARSNPSYKKRKPAVLYSIGHVKKMVLNGEGAAVTAGLSAIATSAQRNDPSVWGSHVTTPWLTAIATNQRFLTVDLAGVFDSLDFEGLIADAHHRARMTGRPASALLVDRITAGLRAALQEAA